MQKILRQHDLQGMVSVSCNADFFKSAIKPDLIFIDEADHFVYKYGAEF